MHEALGGQIALSAVIVFLMQAFKDSPLFPYISSHTDRLNRVAALVLSGMAAVGIHWAYDTNFSWIDGGHITILWPGLWAVGHGAWDWLQSFAMQEWMYRSTVKSAAVKV